MASLASKALLSAGCFFTSGLGVSHRKAADTTFSSPPRAVAIGFNGISSRPRKKAAVASLSGHRLNPISSSSFENARMFRERVCSQNWRSRGRKATITSAFYGYEPSEKDILGESIAEDFYSVLGVSPEASGSQIKQAYYSMMKECHPDLTGENPDSTAFCKFINEVYEVLSDADQRAIYDEINGFTLTSQNPFMNVTLERDQAFVDEFSCIGCKNCANCAPGVFEIESDFGRARVMDQTGEAAELVQEAIDTCPVECIHWVTIPQLTLLEDEMRRLERVNVGIMLAGQGYGGQDVFTQAAWRWDKRQARAVEKARAKAYQEKQAPPGKKKTPFWAKAPWEMAEDLVGGSSYESDDEEATRERTASGMSRAKAMAAAARRWRDASRTGTDRKPKFALPAPKEEELVRR